MRKDLFIQITREELQRLMIVGCHLHQWQGKGQDGIKKVIREHGFVQLDPLNPAGRYHDLFFSSRIPDYLKGQFEQIVYREKIVFETYFHNLNAIYIDHFPFFYSQTLDKKHLGRYYSRALKILEETHPDMVGKVLNHVQTHGLTQGSDLVKLGKSDPKYAVWKTSRNSGTVLELLWAMGKLAVIRDKNFRKKYDLIERYVEKSLLNKRSFTDEKKYLYSLKLKLRSFPVIPLGKISLKKDGKVRFGKKVDINLDQLLKNPPEKSKEEIIPSVVQIEDKSNGYIVPSNWKELCQKEIDREMRVIGPLDPLIWDRKLVSELFDFDYSWEVYKKPKDRVWGYYVYPLLYRGNFIGRLEAKFESRLSKLKIFNFQEEKHFAIDFEVEKAFICLFNRWKAMVKAKDIEFDKTVPLEITEKL